MKFLHGMEKTLFSPQKQSFEVKTLYGANHWYNLCFYELIKHPHVPTDLLLSF